MAENLCKSCNQPSSSNFCSNCGEKGSNKRLTVKDLIGDFMSNIMELEYPLLRTVKELSYKPGVVCREYVEGKRKPYYKPFQYFIITVALFYIIFFAFGLELSEVSKEFIPEGVGDNSRSVADMKTKVAGIINSYIKLIQFCVIPIISFFSWAFFKVKGYNMVENFVMNLFLAAHGSMIGILFIPLSVIDFNVYFISSSIATIFYQIWGYKQFFEIGALTAIAKGLIIWLCTMVSLLIFGGIAIVMFIFYTTNIASQ